MKSISVTLYTYNYFNCTNIFMLMKCFILILFFFTKNLVIVSCNEFNIIRNSPSYSEYDSYHQIFSSICITDTIEDAIIWNTHLDWIERKLRYSDRINLQKLSELSDSNEIDGNKRKCNINVSDDGCRILFSEKSNWNLVFTSEIPMGPVFDYRWEMFDEHNTFEWKSLVHYREIHPNVTFNNNGAIVVSIRSKSNGHILICDDADHKTSRCYWIIIGGWDNTETGIRKCEEGVNGYPESDSPCKPLQKNILHHPLSLYEWRTFVITWDFTTKTINLYDPDEMILSYTDYNAVHDTDKKYYLFFGNPEFRYPTQFRFHKYNYTLARRDNARMVSELLNINGNGEICIDMLIGLCDTCDLHANLIDSTTRRLIKNITFNSSTSQKVQHGLPMWQHARIHALNIDEDYGPVILELITESSDNRGNHWAISNVQQCSVLGTVKRVKMTVSQDKNKGIFLWPTVTCQRLSYNQKHSQIISPLIAITDPPENITLCPIFYIGPNCATSCHPNFDSYCQAVTICDENRCYCSQGHYSYNCQNKCSEHGSFGYGCKEKCKNCYDEDCDIYTGSCTVKCKKLQTKRKHLLMPHCNDVVESPESKFDQIDDTSLRIYFPKINHDKKYNITYEIELQINSNEIFKKYVQIGQDNELTSIYFAIFNKLQLGTKYRARVSQYIKYLSLIKLEKIHIDGEFSKTMTMCTWTKQFEVELDDKNITIQKMDDENLYPCPDNWYTVKIFLATADNSEYKIQINDITNVNEKFPMEIRNLTVNTNYIISITGMNWEFEYQQQIRTLVSKPTQVRDLKINYINSTEIFISWLPPEQLNDNLYGYYVTIEPLYHMGCLGTKSMSFMKTQSYTIDSDTQSYNFSNLIPYVHYKLTILAYHTRNGDETSITFTTNATEIPTAIYENVEFIHNKIKWNLPIVNCTSVTGPIRATRLFFIGQSENVVDFNDEYDTKNFLFILNKTKKQNIYGCEKYQVRIHSLRDINGIHNITAFTKINFTTDPQPPPEVRNFTIVEVDSEARTSLLRWEKPLPPTNGEIIKYKIYFIDIYYEISSVITVFPNETCRLWINSLCKKVFHPYQSRNIIQVRAVNKDVRELGDTSEIPDISYETAPDPPKNIFIIKKNYGIINLKWIHPLKTGGPMKKFIIQCELIKTRLIKHLHHDDYNKTLIYSIISYENLYTTELNLLPSTHYKINIRGIVRSSLIGNPISAEIQTTSSFSWYKDEPSFIVNNNTHTIDVFLPSIANNTHNTEIHIVVIGQLLCSEIPILSEDLIRNIDLKNNEIAWHVESFSTLPSSVIIGDYKNNITHCSLRVGNSYIIVIVVRENNIEKWENTMPYIWRSRPVQFGPVPRQAHEIWAVPLFLLIIILAGLLFYFTRQRKRSATKTEINTIVDVPNPERIGIKNPIKSQSSIITTPCPNTVEYRESIILTPTTSIEKINSSLINEDKCEKIKYNLPIKLNEFQDYVKCAISSGELDKQYSIFPRGQMKSWAYGEIPENKRKNRYGNLIAYDETRVILEKLPDDPHSDYINANYIKGYKKNCAYIATQGPKPTTVIDFWRMIWQERVQVICMLANVMESGKTKCEQYWPEIGKVKKYGNISVSNISHISFADYTFRIFHIKCDQEIRKIEHLHYTAWPDHGIPLYTQSVVSYLKKLLATPSGSGPVVVHCSAGVGRTGTIILCDICLRRAAAEGVVDVFGETEKIRKQRANMVDNKQQYILAHVALVECLLSLPTSIPCNDSLPTRIQEYKNQLTLQQQRLEQSAWQDEALQSTIQTQLKLSEKNMLKIRFPDLVSISRLYLSRYPTSDDDSSYIFGVYVDSARRQNNFIATQIPLPTTVSDFWRMIAEFKVQLIIILQQFDPEDSSCCKFIPEPNEEMVPLTFLNLKGKSVTDGEHCTQQKITLTDNSTNISREQSIKVLTCKEWDPGRNKPPPQPVALVNLWQMAERISKNDEPAVVVCHDGVTGCGLYLAMSFLLERMGLEHECDVCLAIRAIRRSRSNFCQTQDQFEYLYDAAVIYAGYFQTYANFT